MNVVALIKGKSYKLRERFPGMKGVLLVTIIHAINEGRGEINESVLTFGVLY